MFNTVLIFLKEVRVTLSKKDPKEVEADDRKTPLFDKVNLEETETPEQETDLKMEDISQEDLDQIDPKSKRFVNMLK